MNNRQEENLNVFHEEVNDILGFIPRWIPRWGILLVVFMLITLMVFTWFFKYPEVLPSRVKLVTEIPPVELVSRVNGRLEKILVNDKDSVKEGEIIGIVKNTARYQDVLHLSKVLESFSLECIDSINLLPLVEKNMKLGEVQLHFSNFAMGLKEIVDYQNINLHQQKINAKIQESKEFSLYRKQLKAQAGILKRDMELSYNQYKRDSLLFLSEVISNTTFEKSEANYLGKKYRYQNILVDYSEAGITLARLDNEIISMELNAIKIWNKLKQENKNNYDNLLNAINEWEIKYVFRSPVNGMVSFTKYWSDNQPVFVNDKVFTLVPFQSGRIIGRVILPPRGAGRIEVGQKVNIKLTNYPYMEYGMLKGKVRSISATSRDEHHVVEIEIPGELITTYNKNINFVQEMPGKVEIITEELRLAHRLLNPFRVMFSEGLN